MQLDRRDRDLGLQNERSRHIQLLQSSKSKNVTLKTKKNGKVERILLPFSDFLNFGALAFGHHHDPRASRAKDIFDAGGYVDHIETSLEIRDSGRITRPFKHEEEQDAMRFKGAARIHCDSALRHQGKHFGRRGTPVIHAEPSLG